MTKKISESKPGGRRKFVKGPEKVTGICREWCTGRCREWRNGRLKSGLRETKGKQWRQIEKSIHVS
jgi:hypothetical protein